MGHETASESLHSEQGAYRASTKLFLLSRSFQREAACFPLFPLCFVLTHFPSDGGGRGGERGEKDHYRYSFDIDYLSSLHLQLQETVPSIRSACQKWGQHGGKRERKEEGRRDEGGHTGLRRLLDEALGAVEPANVFPASPKEIISTHFPTLRQRQSSSTPSRGRKRNSRAQKKERIRKK
jgi:hypothetical protein